MTKTNDRRNFLEAAGATIVAASSPAAAVAQLAEKTMHTAINPST